MAVTTLALLASLLAVSTYITYRNADFTHSISAEGWNPSSTAIESGDLANSKVDINEFLIGVIENFKDDMKVGIPEVKIPVLDPFVSQNTIRVDVQDNTTAVQGNFTDVHIEGLSTFVLDNLQADLKNLSLTFQLHIPMSRAYGNYSLNGSVFDIIPLRGNGKFRIQPHNLILSVHACLENSEDDRLQLTKDFDVDMDFDKVDLYLEKYVGANRWNEVLETLNTTKEELFKKCVPMLEGELRRSLFKVINLSLKKLPITSIIPGSTANEYVDQLLKNVRYYIIYKELDPMELPDHVANFSKKIMLVTFNGEAKMYDGYLFGISTLHRTDNCRVKTYRNTIAVSAHLGVSHLRFIYKGHAKFMSFGPTLRATGSIEKVSFYFKIMQSNKKGAQPVLREFEIDAMSTIWIELSGLGPLTWIMNWLLRGISTLIDNFMYEKLTDALRGYIQNELKKYSFPL